MGMAREIGKVGEKDVWVGGEQGREARAVEIPRIINNSLFITARGRSLYVYGTAACKFINPPPFSTSDACVVKLSNEKGTMILLKKLQ